MNEIFYNMVGDGGSTSWTYFWYEYTVNLIYSPENMKLMNRKQIVLFGGKQLQGNT